ncbi:MAG: hypothetical protein JWR35_2438 [Marmoricola sp.]|jgi:hypothetical protein|nr:hypothetical protein [Marmoricola sp.]
MSNQAARKNTRGLRGLASLPNRIRDLEAGLLENRQLNRRIAELTDIVTELLIPIADRDDAKVQELLAHYRATTLGS